MVVQFKSESSQTPCGLCEHFKKGRAGIFCGRKPKLYINFIKKQGQVKRFCTYCRFYINKETGVTVKSGKKKFTYPCISLWNPWAWSIPNAMKDIENRTWEPRWKGKPLRAEILIHAAKRQISDQNWKEYQYYFDSEFNVYLPEMDQIKFGGIIGKANLVDCVTKSNSPWYEVGKTGWVLQDQRTIDFIPFRGQQGIFEYHSNIEL